MEENFRNTVQDCIIKILFGHALLEGACVQTGGSGFNFWQGQWIFSSSPRPDRLSDTIDPHQTVTPDLFRGVKPRERQADYSYPSRARVRNV
jgi:hypothetical protein